MSCSRLHVLNPLVVGALAAVALWGVLLGIRFAAISRRADRAASNPAPVSQVHARSGLQDFKVPILDGLGVEAGESVRSAAFLEDGDRLWSAVVLQGARGRTSGPSHSRVAVLRWERGSNKAITVVPCLPATDIEQALVLKIAGVVHVLLEVGSELQLLDLEHNTVVRRLKGPEGEQWNHPFRLLWPRAVHWGGVPLQVGAIRIGGVDGDRLCLWSISGDGGAPGSAAPNVVGSDLGGRHLSLSDLFQDERGGLYAVVAAKELDDPHRKCYLIGPLSDLSGASPRIRIDVNYPAINARLLPKTPRCLAAASPGLPLAVAKDGVAYFLWQSKWRREHARLVARAVRLSNGESFMAHVLYDNGTTAPLCEHTLALDASGEVMAVWSTGGSGAPPAIHRISLRPEGPVGRESLLPLPDSSAPRDPAWPGIVPHLCRSNGTVLCWWVDEDEGTLRVRTWSPP